MTIKIFPYKQGSRGAKALAEALGCRVLKKVGSKYRYREGDLIINYGASDCPFVGPHVANQPDAVAAASNKLTAFETMKAAGVNTPKFWEDYDDIIVELLDATYPIVCRTKLNGHSGEGIVIANTVDELVDAPLYVQYVKKQDEYRVHCFRKRGEATSIISVQRKARRLDVENPNWQVRNHANGFVYVRDDVESPEMVLEQAVQALEALGLAFGAVDVIWNAHEAKAYVLEVNTAPGLEGQTVLDYSAAFKGMM